MGQITGKNDFLSRVNLRDLATLPTPAAGEHILVSSDNSMNANGQGNFDCYIMGDGTTAADKLVLQSTTKNIITVEEKTLATLSDFRPNSCISKTNVLGAANSHFALHNFPVSGYEEITIHAYSTSYKIAFTCLLDSEYNVVKWYNSTSVQTHDYTFKPAELGVSYISVSNSETDVAEPYVMGKKVVRKDISSSLEQLASSSESSESSIIANNADFASYIGVRIDGTTGTFNNHSALLKLPISNYSKVIVHACTYASKRAIFSVLFDANNAVVKTHFSIDTNDLDWEFSPADYNAAYLSVTNMPANCSNPYVVGIITKTNSQNISEIKSSFASLPQIKMEDFGDADFALMDDNNYAIALFKDGHIQTKNFNSKDAAAGGNISKYRGKRLGIIGDSISTFNGTMPSGYATFYPSGDVISVDKLWWKIVASNLDMTTVNRSWSGSRVCGDGTSTSSAQAGCSTKRVNDLTENDVAPDVIIIWMGINDFGYPTNNWTPLGDFGKSSKELPTDSSNVSTFSEGYGILVSKVMSTYPKAKVFCCTLMQTGYATKDHKTTGVWPTENLGEITLEEYNERIREIAHCLGASIIDIASCGIHFWNFSNYTIDQLHPNEAGQAIVGNFVTTQLLNNI